MGSGRSARAGVFSPFVGQNLRAFVSTQIKEDLAVLKELIEAEKVTPIIDKTYGLSEVPEAIGYVGERHTQGKTVIAV